MGERRRGGRHWAALAAATMLSLGGLAILGVAPPAGASGPTTWYVAAGGTGTACTETDPCGTVAAAVALAGPGDTIEVQGDIAGNVEVTSSEGTPSEPLTIEQWPGQPAGTLDGAHSGTVLTIGSGAGANLSGLSVANGSTSGPGGGIENAGTLTVTGSTISGNTSSYVGTNGGGGIESSGTLTVTGSTISGNSVNSGGGGGIEVMGGTAAVTGSTVSGNSAGAGGGIATMGGTGTVTDSTISGNSAGSAGNGGGIFDISRTVTVEDSTISGNSAGNGGGIFLEIGADATVTGSTISGNTASLGGAAIENIGSTVILAGDILATAAGAPAGGECVGVKTPTFTDAGYNIDDDGTCGLSSANHSVSHSTTIDSYLAGSLSANGGPTETIALLAGAASGDNPAQAVIPSSFDLPTGQAACSRPDQRGIARAATCDMGAYALSTATLYATAASASPAPGADCTTIALACTLTTAVAQVEAEGTIELITPGTTVHYGGGLTVSTAGTSAGAPVTIEAAPGLASAPVLDGGGTEQVLYVSSGVNLDLSGVTITGGNTSGPGGGIENAGTLTVTGSTISGNTSSYVGTNGGGGIESSGTLTVTGSTISGNTAAAGGGGGGGIEVMGGTAAVTGSTISGNSAAAGGGIQFQGGTGTVTDSTISGNTASSSGGGIFDISRTVTVEDSTISGNSGGEAGGGILIEIGGTLTVTGSTISGNTSVYGAAIFRNGSTVILAGDILATAAGPPAGGECAGDRSGTFTDAGYNIDDDGTCGLSSANHSVSHSTTIDGSLSAGLANNGGPTDTILPSPGSPAARVIPPNTSVDGGAITLCTGNDQRGSGFPRPATGTTLCSMGAVEAPAGTAPDFTSAASTSFTVGTAGSFTVATSGIPDASLSESGTLPSGVTFTDNGDGTATLAGTPASGTEAAYPLTLTAANGVSPDATQSFTLTIGQATPALSTTASAGITFGEGTVSDTATLSGGTSPTGTLTFTLYGPNDATCGGSAAYTDTVTVTANGTYPSGTFTPTSAGTYRWVASYSGDANNAPVSGSCGDTGESVIVARATPMITWTAPSAITYGTALSAAQLDATASVPGTFVYTPPAGTVLGVGAGQPLSVAFTPTDSTDYTTASGATTIDVTAVAPGAPTGVTATASTGTSTITLTWSPPASDGGSPITGYQVFRGTSPGLEGSTPIATVTGTTYADTAVVPGTTYYYVVAAVTGSGTSTPSAEVSARLSAAGATGHSLAATPGGAGWWLVHPDGGVFTFGDAGFYGSMGGKPLNRPVVGITSTPDGKGYWLVGADGGVFAFGDAGFYGSLPGLGVRVTDIVGVTSTPDGKGYWLVGADGGVFAFGDAGFYGSMGGKPLNRPVVGIIATPDGKGYWLVASDGGVFTFGDAGFYGSMGGKPLNRPVVGIIATPDGKGYWLVASDGGVFTFGDASYEGSLGGTVQSSPILGLAPLTGGGYELINADGTATRFGG